MKGPTTEEAHGGIPKVSVAPEVYAEAKSDSVVKVTWVPVEEKGVAASRYRVICHSMDPRREPIKIASTTRTEVEIETFEAGYEYTCSVFGIWDDLVPGIEVISTSPGISNPFRVPNASK